MTDIRGLRASALLDPYWHWLAAASDRLYGELETGARMVGLSLTVLTPEGVLMSYALVPGDPEVSRAIFPDPSAVARLAATLSINATPDAPDAAG